MKQMLLAIFTALLFEAPAQVTITNATFPSAGDTLEYAVDTDPANLTASIATPPGSNQTWNLLGLQADQSSQLVYQPASAGAHAMSYTGAELVVLGPTTETYYDLSSTKFSAIGYAGSSAISFGTSALARYNPILTERKSPLNFFDNTSQTANLSLPFAIPPALLDSLNLNLPVSPDSLRARVKTERIELVDGWGKCQIPGGIYDVLRVKRTEYRTTGLDIHASFIGWVDIQPFLGGAGGALANFFQTDTSITYRFYNNVEKEDIAVATMSNDQTEVTQVQYKNNAVTPTIDLDSPGAASIQAYPNPAVEWVRFNCANLPQGEYTLKIFNIIGKVVWKENYKLTGSKSIRIELDDFKKGTYLYSLTDGLGNIIGTKRLVILKP